MRIFGQPTRPSMASRGGTSNRGGAAYRPMGVRDDPVTGAPILPGTQPPPWTARPRPGTAAGGTPDRLPTRPRAVKQESFSVPTYGRQFRQADLEQAKARYVREMASYLEKISPHTSRFKSRYGSEAFQDYLDAQQIGSRPQLDQFRYGMRSQLGGWKGIDRSLLLDAWNKIRGASEDVGIRNPYLPDYYGPSMTRTIGAG